MAVGGKPDTGVSPEEAVRKEVRDQNKFDLRKKESGELRRVTSPSETARRFSPNENLETLRSIVHAWRLDPEKIVSTIATTFNLEKNEVIKLLRKLLKEKKIEDITIPPL